MDPLVTLLDRTSKNGLLIPELAALYDGQLALPPAPANRPYIAFNFVHGVDGPITYGLPGQSSGGEISGHNEHDAFVMGLLRAVFGTMAEGANAIRQNPSHLWTPEYASPDHAALFAKEAHKLRGHETYRIFFVTASGNLKPQILPGLPEPPKIPVTMKSLESEVWILTTDSGKGRFLRDFPNWEFTDGKIVTFGQYAPLEMKEVMRFLRQELDVQYLLVEGGARFAGSLIKEYLYDELFLTASNLLVGSSDESRRLTFAWGVDFTPENAPRHEILSIKTDGPCGHFILTRRHRLPQQLSDSLNGSKP